MEAKKLKTSADYPQFYCRMKADEKKKIMGLLARIKAMEAKLRKKGMKKVKGNEFIFRGLELGLTAIEKHYSAALAKKKPTAK